MGRGARSPSAGLSQADVQALASLIQAGNFREAERKTRKLLKRYSDAIVLYNILSAAQLSQQKFTDAAETLEKALSLNPGFVDGEYNLALAYMNLDRAEDAVERLKNVIRQRPNLAEAYNNLGAMHLKLNYFDLAVENYRKALELKPDFVQAIRNLGVALRDLGQLEEAEEYLSKIPLIQPRFAAGHYSLGVVQRGLGKKEKAINSFKTALKLDPDLNEAHYELGSLYLENEDWDNAIASFGKAQTVDSSTRVLETMMHAGQVDNVKAGLERIIQDQPKNLRTAAFSAYASHQFDIPNSHPFCRNPLDFVSIRQPEVCAGDQQFLDELMTAADGLTVMWERNTTRGGFQTHGNLFDPVWESEAFKRLEKLIRGELADLQNRECGLARFDNHANFLKNFKFSAGG